MSTVINKIENDVFSIGYTDDGLYLMEVRPNKEYTIAHMEVLYAAQKELGGRKLPSLILCGEQASTSPALMNYLAKNDTNPYSVAEAYVLSSTNQKILASIYMKIVKPKRPTRFFTDEKLAREWLETFK